MSNTNNGGPAFPSPVDMYDGRTESAVRGMTLRDYFAGQVICGLMAREGAIDAPLESALAYIVADAMLMARAKAEGAAA